MLLSAWLDKHPNDFFAHAVLGDAWYAGDKLELAGKEWQQAGNLTSLIKYGWDAHGKGEWTKAIALFQAATELSPQAGALGLAAALDSNQETAQAETVVRTALNASPATIKRADLVLMLANIVAHDGRWDEALNMYQEVLAMDSMNATAFFGYGEALYHTGNFDAAIASLQHGVTLAPRSAKGYEVLADINSELLRYAEADMFYKHAIEFSPDTLWLLIRRGNNALAASDFATAIESYEAALQQHGGTLDAKQSASVYHSLSLAYEEVGDIIRASFAERNAKAANFSDKYSARE